MDNTKIKVVIEHGTRDQEENPMDEHYWIKEIDYKGFRHDKIMELFKNFNRENK